MANANDEKASADGDKLTLLAARIVTAYIERNQIAAADIPNALRSVSAALHELGTGSWPAAPSTPAVPIKRSIFTLHITGGKDVNVVRFRRSTYALSASASSDRS